MRTYIIRGKKERRQEEGDITNSEQRITDKTPKKEQYKKKGIPFKRFSWKTVTKTVWIRFFKMHIRSKKKLPMI